LRGGALPAVLALDKDVCESKFSTDFISRITALDDRAAGNDGGIVINIYCLAAAFSWGKGKYLCCDSPSPVPFV
jgi:hypothetical protein